MEIFTASNVSFMLQGLFNTIVISLASIGLSIIFGTSVDRKSVV